MTHLYSKLIIGLIFLSSSAAFAESTSYSTDITDISARNAEPMSETPSKSFSVPSSASTAAAALTPDPDPKTIAPKGVKAGYENAIGEVTKTYNTWESALSECPAAKSAGAAAMNGIKEGLGDFTNNYDACKDREDQANTYCRESRNPDMKEFMMVGQPIISAISGSGIMDACSKLGQVLNLGSKALTAYQTGCATMRGYCTNACGKAFNGVKKMADGRKPLIENVVSAAEAAAAAATASGNTALASACSSLATSYRSTVEGSSNPIDRELKTDDSFKPVAQKLKTCDSYKKELAAVGIGLFGVLNSLGQANNCKNSTNGASATAAKAVDCTIEANKKNNMTCICKDNPRMAGCTSGLDTAAVAKSGDSLRAAGSGSYTPEASSGKTSIDVGGEDGMDLASKGTDGSSSLPGAPSGGGGAGLGGSGGFGGGADNGAAMKKANGLNTNILGGEGGGGGGGAWGGYRGGGDPALRQYLPGGAKDPSAQGMAGAAVSKQVTSQGGKSNWEKVKDRYRDNKPTLLGY